MVATFPALLGQTFRTLIARWRSVLAMVAAVTTILVISQGLYDWRVETYRSSLFDQAAVEQEAMRLDALLDRQRAGDQTVATQVALARRRMSERLRTLAGNQTLMGFWMNLGPALVLSWLLAFSAIIMALLFGMRGVSSFPRVLIANILHMAHTALRLSLLLVSLFGVSLLWLPAGAIVWIYIWPESLTDTGSIVQTALVFFGYFIAILLLPRLLLAPVRIVEGDTTITEAMRESYASTRGHWSKVLWNVIGTGVLLCAAGILLLLVLAPVLVAAPLPMLIVREFLTAASVIIFGMFLRHLSVTVRAHPREYPEELVVEVQHQPEAAPAASQAQPA